MTTEWLHFVVSQTGEVENRTSLMTSTAELSINRWKEPNSPFQLIYEDDRLVIFSAREQPGLFVPLSIFVKEPA